MRRLLIIGVIGLFISACGGATSQQSSSTAVSKCPNPSDRGSVTVMAASSMVNVFKDIKTQFLSEYPCVTAINFSYGSSSTLATQIVNGAPVDVYVSASQSAMGIVTSAKVNASSPFVFARNQGEIMVYPRSEYRNNITTIQDLHDSRNSGIRVGLCVASAPCGSLANSILTNSRSVYSNTTMTRIGVADTESASVEELVTKIELGELDAGIVYRSDCEVAQPLGLAACVELPSKINVSNAYLGSGMNTRQVTSDFLTFLNSSLFKKYLQEKYAFLAP
jgi:molybdate transport system substrate-binding protein